MSVSMDEMVRHAQKQALYIAQLEVELKKRKVEEAIELLKKDRSISEIDLGIALGIAEGLGKAAEIIRNRLDTY